MQLGTLYESRRQEAQDLVAAKKSEERYLEFSGKDRPVEQWGIPMTAELFERKLAKIDPRFVSEEFSTLELKPAVLQGWPVDQPWHHKKLLWKNGNKCILLCHYFRHTLPEWTVLFSKKEFLPNPEILNNVDRPVSTKDLGAAFDPNKPVDWDADPADDSILYTSARVMNGVAIRGWREILLILLESGLINLTQVEKEFGSGNSPLWKIKTGKGSKSEGYLI